MDLLTVKVESFGKLLLYRYVIKIGDDMVDSID
jgi:hypothetical protein